MMICLTTFPFRFTRIKGEAVRTFPISPQIVMSATCQPSLEPAVPLASVAPATCPSSRRDLGDASGTQTVYLVTLLVLRFPDFRLTWCHWLCRQAAGPCEQLAATCWRALAWAARSTAWSTPTGANRTPRSGAWGAGSRSVAPASASEWLPSCHRDVAVARRSSARQVRERPD